MGDPNWQDVNGSIFFIGGTGYITICRLPPTKDFTASF